MTTKTPFELMMEQSQKFAQDMVTSMNPALSSFDPKAFEAMWPTMPKDAMEMWFGKGFSKEGLDAKTRLLLTLSGLVMQGAQAETPLRMTVRHAIEAGTTKEEIVDTITHMSMFAGIPAMNRALELSRAVMADKKDDET